MTLVRWSTSHFKADEPSRVDRALEKEKADAAVWKAVCAAVDLRDGKQCRCCDKRSDPEATGLLKRGHRHHLIYRSAGGVDESWNLITLCATCHNEELHRNKLRIDGPTMPIDADGPVSFLRRGDDGEWFVVREEIAVRVVRKD